MMQGQITDAKIALRFMLAGKATVTLRDEASGQRFTYKITLAEKRQPTDTDTWFVSLLNGPDNWTNYAYIGIMKNENNQPKYIWTAKAKAGRDAASVKAIGACVAQLAAGTMQGFEVWHIGKCGRCNRPLTVPESIATGFGPECASMIGGQVSLPTNPTAVGGFPAPQKSRKPAAQGTLFNKGVKINGRAAAQALYAPASSQSLEQKIDTAVANYRVENPEAFWMDGELTEEEAVKVARNKFRHQFAAQGVQ
jgi:hypothetical protein